MEPAGALAIAGLKKYAMQNDVSDQTLVAVTSGANMDFDRLRFVSERADTSETIIACTIPEKPGMFMRLHNQIHPRNLTEFRYRISDDPKKHDAEAQIYLGFQASDKEDAESVLKNISNQGWRKF